MLWTTSPEYSLCWGRCSRPCSPVVAIRSLAHQQCSGRRGERRQAATHFPTRTTSVAFSWIVSPEMEIRKCLGRMQRLHPIYSVWRFCLVIDTRNLLHRGDLPRLLQGHYSSAITPTDSCAN